MSLNKHIKEFVGDLRAGNFDVTPEGIVLKKSVLLAGYWEEGIVGQPDSYLRHKNLIPTEGINSILNVMFGATAKHAAFYIAPFSGSATPAASWTAANFASNASEITSLVEGFSEVTRPQAVFGTATTGSIDNYAAKAQFTIETASQLTIKGAGLLTNNTRGGTSGVLCSAVKFAQDRVLNDADIWESGYLVSLTDS